MGSEERLVEEVDLGRGYVVRLFPGDDFFPTITRLLRALGLSRGAFLSAIGSMVNASFRNLQSGAELPVSLEKTSIKESSGPFELLSLEGNFVPMGAELQFNVHVMLGQQDGSVVGGHLFSGTVYTTMEIVLVELRRSGVIKGVSAQTGLPEWRYPTPG